MKTQTQKGILRGFTLIELLVVVSIIGMLSSVILVALQSARQKGNVGAGLKFSSYNYHALGADALVIWNFDEGPSVAYAKDLSSNNISGIFSTGVSKSNLQTPANGGYSAFFSNTSSYIRGDFHLLPSSVINLSGGFTVSLWVRPDGTGSSGTLVDTYNSTDNTDRPFAIRLTPNVTILCNGSWNATSYAAVNNIWQHVAVSYKNPSSYSLYINGQLKTTLGSCTPPSGLSALSMKYLNVAVEDYNGTVNAFRGNIDEVAVYKQTLLASDIQKIYAEGLKTHQLADAGI